MRSEIPPFYAKLVEQLPFGALVVRLQDPADDTSLRLVYANPMAAQFAGFDVQAGAGNRILEIFPATAPDQVAALADSCRAQRAGELPANTFGELQVKDGFYRLSSLPLGEGCVACLFECLSATRRAEADARALNRFFDSIVEHLPAKIFLKNAKDLTFIHVNRACEELLGLTRGQLLGKSDHDFFPKEQADFFVKKDREVLESKTPQDIPEEPIETVHGPRWLHTRKIGIFDEAGEPEYLLGISLDITERKRKDELLRASHQQLQRDVVERTLALDREADQRRLAEEALLQAEEQLRHAQKMEAIGKLAGGVAHDFNNLLTIVLSYCDVILHDASAGERMRHIAREIRGAGERAADLTHQLLAFSRQQVLQSQIVDLNAVVAKMQHMVQRLLGEDIELTLRPQADLKLVKADPSQLEQVIMNLVVNARDAMPTGGTLLIETANVELDESHVAGHLGASPGPHVMLAVRDTGVGMDKGTLSRIFEPFFTTKEHSKGTGLGLSTVFGIVRQSGGFTWVDSEPKKGATFKIFLPAAKEARTTPPPPLAPSMELTGSETILLVEDEDRVREVAASIMRHHGYTVLEASRPSQAIALATAQPTPVDMLLTDVVMPEMGGRALAERLTQLIPGLQILFMSGYTDDAIMRHGVLESSVNFLQKPLTQETLLRRVRDVLEARQRHSA